jgi:hypothetical protein
VTFPVVLLWITSVLFAGFGIGFAAVPEQLADFVFGGSPATTSALTDMRATYGGLSIGLAAFYALCASRPQWVRPGVLASLLVLVGLAVARLIGIAADGSPNGFILLILGTEIVAAILFFAALRQIDPA